MAAQKTTGSPKRTGASKTGSKTPQRKKQSSPSHPKSVQNLENLKRIRFIKGVVLLCFTFFFLLLFFMQGESAWRSLHECYRGVFGFLGIIVPMILVYCAAQMFRIRSTYRFPLKVFFFSGTIVMFATMLYAFGSSGMALESYGTELANCFRAGSHHHGSGLIGGLLGIPMAKLLGSMAGGMVSLLILAFFVYMSFEALFMNLIDRIKEPVSDKIVVHREVRNRVREEERKLRNENKQITMERDVQIRVDKKINKKKQKQQSEFNRIDKVPIYQPEESRHKPTAEAKKPVSNQEDATALHPDGADMTLSEKTKDKTQETTGIEGLIPDISPRHPKKKKEPVLSPETEPEAVEEPDQEPLDIAQLLETEEADAEDPGNYDDVLRTVFGSRQPKKTTTPPPVSPAPPVPASVRQKEEPADHAVHKEPEEDKVRPAELYDFGVIHSNTELPYLVPPFTLLEPQPEEEEQNISQELHQNANKLVETLKSFGVQTTITNISRGPSVTRYELQPASGVKISKITNLSDDIAMNLAATGVRIEAPIPGKNAVGIEVPNRIVSVVKMRSLVESREFQNAKSRLTVALGKDITGKITLADLSRMPHLLIAGSTGSGKSVCINSMLVSLLYKASPDEVKLMLIDPKVVELGVYNGIPHLLVPVVTDPRKAAGALNWAVNEMLERYKTFAEYNVRDMHSYNRLVDKQNAEADKQHTENQEAYLDDNERTFEEDEMLAQAQAEIKNAESEPKEIRKLEKMAQIVIVIDELADLMMAAPNEVEESICRLAQMARAAGMHLVIATQRPSVDVITGLIKANVPSRIAFAVKSQIDSRTILDSSGAEKLLGRGDMLFSPIGTTKPIRVQGCFVDDNEIESIVEFIKTNRTEEITYDKDVIDQIERSAAAENSSKSADTEDSALDPVMEQAIQCVVEAGQASTSLLQRRLRLGYARAGRLIDEMEQMGIVGPHEGSKPRQVLMTYQQWLERSMSQSDG